MERDEHLDKIIAKCEERIAAGYAGSQQAGWEGLIVSIKAFRTLEQMHEAGTNTLDDGGTVTAALDQIILKWPERLL